MPAISSTLRFPDEIQRRTELLILYLRSQVGPDDQLLQSLLQRQSGTEATGSLRDDPGNVYELAETCGLVQIPVQIPAQIPTQDPAHSTARTR